MCTCTKTYWNAGRGVLAWGEEEGAVDQGIPGQTSITSNSQFLRRNKEKKNFTSQRCSSCSCRERTGPDSSCWWRSWRGWSSGSRRCRCCTRPPSWCGTSWSWTGATHWRSCSPSVWGRCFPHCHVCNRRFLGQNLLHDEDDTNIALLGSICKSLILKQIIQERGRISEFECFFWKCWPRFVFIHDRLSCLYGLTKRRASWCI